MAIAFCRVSIHTRSQGHSAVAGAAYRSGSQLEDERTGEVHNFENRKDVLYCEVMLPEGADPRFRDRQALWNAVEACERRKDAQLAKDIIIALPRDVTLEHQVALAKNFAEYHFVSKGIVADIAVHDYGDGNPHAHIYVTTRRLKGNQFDRYKARDLNPSFVNSPNGKGFISEHDYWGEQWRDFQNHYFEDRGIDLCVDENHLFSHRHEGRVRGKESHFLKADNQLKREAALEIALNDPANLLNRLSTRYAVFSERQLASLIFKSTETIEQFQQAMAQVKAHPDVVCLGFGDDGRLRYTTRATYRKEARLSQQAAILTRCRRHPVAESVVTTVLTRYALSDEQRIALQHIVDGPDLCSIVGRAGTGKSYLMNPAREIWEQSGYRLQGLAVSGIAAKGLQTGSQIPSSTIASFKRRLIQGPLSLTEKDIVVMDEASMTDLNDMALIVKVVREANAKLVTIGDPNQLQPIGPGAPFRALIEKTGFAEIQHIRRQKDPADQRASQWLALGHIDKALAHYEQKGSLYWHETPRDAMDELIDQWAVCLSDRGIENAFIIAHRNADIESLNQLAREKLIAIGKVSPQGSTVTVKRKQPADDGWNMMLVEDTLTLAAGDRLLFRKNDRSLGVCNGELATVLAIQGDQITVQMDNHKKRTFDVRTYDEFSYGYAATIHKTQGITVDNVFIYAGGQGWNRHLAYVALTRHRQHVELHIDRETYANNRVFREKLQQQDIKDSVLDWPIAFAERRGFDPESLIGRLIHKMGLLKEKVKDAWSFVIQHSAIDQKQTKSTQPSNPKNAIHPIYDASLQWDILKTIKNNDAKWLHKYRDLALQKSDKKAMADIYPFMQKHMQSLANDKNAMHQIKEKSPKLAALLSKEQEKTVTINKPLMIDWLSPRYHDEWNHLRKVENTSIQWMVKFYDLLKEKKGKENPKKIESINKSLIDLSAKIANNKWAMDAMKRVAPKLASAIEQREKSRPQNKGIDREY